MQMVKHLNGGACVSFQARHSTARKTNEYFCNFKMHQSAEIYVNSIKTLWLKIMGHKDIPFVLQGAARSHPLPAASRRATPVRLKNQMASECRMTPTARSSIHSLGTRRLGMQSPYIHSAGIVLGISVRAKFQGTAKTAIFLPFPHLTFLACDRLSWHADLTGDWRVKHLKHLLPIHSLGECQFVRTR